MKKILSLILAAIMLFTIAACTKNPAESNTDTIITTDSVETTASETENNELDYNTEFNITVISGTTGMGFAKLMHDSKAGDTKFKYNFDLVTDSQMAVSAITGGNADFAAVPTNLAAVLYKKTNGNIRVVAVNTLGVLYLLENGETVNSISDLKGKTIYCCQQGANPEYITNYLLESNGLEVGKDVFVDFTYNSPDALATAIANGIVDLAVLPEPKVTATMAGNEKLRVALNFSNEWEKINEGEPLPQGCLIATKSFIEENKHELDAFLEEYSVSIDFVNKNPEKAAEYIAEAGIIPKAPLALKAIPRCNIKYLDGNDMASSMLSFFSVLHDANPSSVGGEIPDISLFYTK